METIRCTICGAASRQLPAGLRRCDICQHIFQWPMEVSVKYDAAYAAKYDSYPTTNAMSHLRLGLAATVMTAGDHLIDIGYGNGDFVKLACQAGYQAFGYDVHGQGKKYGVREVDVFASNCHWDLVTFFDSLEHIDELDKVRELNTRTDAVMVTVPKTPVWFPGDRAHTWKHYRPGEHLHYFSEESLGRLFFPKKRQFTGCIEDVIRGKLPKYEQNTLTVIYRG